MSVDKRTIKDLLFNPYKRSASQAFKTEDFRGADLKQTQTLNEGMEASKKVDPALLGKTSKNFGMHRHSSSAQFDSDGAERKVFKFQVDPSLRNDLMKKRMNSKLNLKEITEEGKRGHEDGKSRCEEKIANTLLNYERIKRQSLDVIRLAEEKEDKEASLKKGPQITGKSTFIDAIPNRGAIFSIIEQQKTMNFNKLKERKTANLNASTGPSESLVSRFSKAIEHSKNLRLESKQINFEKKRAPISVVHDLVTQAGNEDDKLIEKHGETIKADQSRKANSRSAIMDKFFSKKPLTGSINGAEDLRRSSYKIEDRSERSQSREVNEVKTQTYYMAAMKYNYSKKNMGPLAISYKEHFIQTFGALKYLAEKSTNMFQYTDIEIVKGKIRSKKSKLDFMIRTFTGDSATRTITLRRNGKTHSGVRSRRDLGFC
jgi:hypothetical protein